VSTYRRSRRARDAGVVVGIEPAQPDLPTPHEAVERASRVRLLSEILERLPERKREVFVLAEIAEMTVPEIAETLGVPLNTAYSRLRSARQAFDAALARHQSTLVRVSSRSASTSVASRAARSRKSERQRASGLCAPLGKRHRPRPVSPRSLHARRARPTSLGPARPAA
jgi:hypothetical protein